MAIFNSFTFDNENSLDSGIYITGEAVFNAPKRVVEMVNVPGRNGAIAIDEGRFENIPVKYPAGCFADNMADFAEKVANFRNILASRFTYKRLEDTYYPDEFRMGLYRSGLEVDVVNQAKAGKFDIEFDCKPQRFLKSGEIPVEYTPGQTPSDEQTKTGSIVTFEAEEGTIISDIKADINPIQSLNGYDKPWVGGAGVNLFPYLNARTATFNGVTFSCDGKGTLTMQGTATANDYASLTFPQAFVIPDGADYKFCMLNTEAHADSVLRFVNGSTIVDSWSPNPVNREATYAGMSGKTVTGIRLYYAQGETYNLTMKPMFVPKTETVTGYIPYENICPISGRTEVVTQRTGKNLIPYPFRSGDRTIGGVTWTMNSDGKLNAHGTATRTAYYSMYGANSTSLSILVPLESIGLQGGDTVTLLSNYSQYVTVQCNKEDGTLVATGLELDGGGSVTKTLPTTAKYVYIGLRVLNGTSINQDNIFVQLEKGSTATDYEPYNGTTYTTALGQTVYGGTLDVVSGVLTVTHASVDMGTLTWNANTISGAPYFLSSALVGGKIVSGGQSSAICEMYATYTGDLTSFSRADAVVCVAPSAFSPSTARIGARDTRFTDAASFKSAVSGVKLVYELATPITVQLTPTEVKALLGVNNVWADSGDITVKYGTNPYIIFNPTDFPSKPLLEVTGVGSFWLGDTQITITGTSGQIIYIDCETGECYKVTGGIISPANGLVTLNRLDFPKLASGINNIQLGSVISKVKITPRWWRL